MHRAYGANKFVRPVDWGRLMGDSRRTDPNRTPAVG